MSVQRLMDWSLSGLDHSFGYLDNVLVYSTVPVTTSTNNDICGPSWIVSANMGWSLTWRSVSAPAMQWSRYLGHSISEGGRVPLTASVEAVQRHSPSHASATPPPTTIKEPQGFLGMVYFYCPFYPLCCRHPSLPHVTASKAARRDGERRSRKGGGGDGVSALIRKPVCSLHMKRKKTPFNYAAVRR